jgi:nitrogen fixation NifU-like protein
MTGTVTGLHVDKAEACCEEITNRLTSGGKSDLAGIDLDKLRALDGVRHYPSRVKCATLAWHALHAALNNETAPASTE